MRTFIGIAALAAAGFAATSIVPAIAATDAECTDMWTKADANKDGKLIGTEGMRYIAFMRVNNKTLVTEGTVTQAEFMEACKGDTYKPRQNDAGAPLKGSNSFTEGQAKDRAMAHGNIESVASLKKDDDGIWRGMAMQNGKETQVAIDYKGNVVTSAQQ
jgi:hypothetical protein